VWDGRSEARSVGTAHANNTPTNTQHTHTRNVGRSIAAAPKDADDGAPLPTSFLVIELDAADDVLRVALREGDGWGPLFALRNVSFGGGGGGGGVAVT
jgi:hypothetical protein